MTADQDLIIIGAGGAGLSAAQYGARGNLRTLVLEEVSSGGQALLIDGLENYPGFPDPINGYDFTKRFEDQARRFGAQFENSGVSAITRDGHIFKVQTDTGVFTAPAVILATGAVHKTLGVPGEAELSGHGVSYCATCDGPFFKGKRMLVVGGGDAACDEASYLAKLSDKIVIAHRKDRFRAQAALAARTLANPSIEVRFGTVVKEIKGEKKVQSVVLEKADGGYEEPFDAVFVFVGSIPQSALAAEAKKDEAGYVITDDRMQSSLPGLFAVGDVRASSFRQLITAASDGAIAAHSASQYIDEQNGVAYA
jgi:thioredoxin reductase (NADPH)